MRGLLLGIGLIVAAMAASVQSGEAAQRAYCLSGNNANGGMPDCSYYTWDQCRAAAAGPDTCYVNPWYSGSQQQPRRRPVRNY